MLRDLSPGADPHVVVLADVFEKANKTYGAARPPDQAVMEANAHKPRTNSPLVVQQIEAVDHIPREVVRRAKSTVLIKAIVIGLVGIRDDQMLLVRCSQPERQLVAEIVAIIKLRGRSRLAIGVYSDRAGQSSSRYGRVRREL